MKRGSSGRKSDIEHMQEAIRLASLSRGHTRPNPPVGAVIAKGGRIIGKGRHVRCGLDHAEAAALKDCTESPEGATLFVTLEPCSREGRKPPCTDAIIRSGIRRVVWACTDPNPANRGRAARILRKEGIETGSGLLRSKALPLILPFSKHVRTGLPFVTVKLAVSLDGQICDRYGDARWISCEKSRRKTGMLREICDAVMVGAQTARADNPSLLCHTRENGDLWRVVVSESGRLPESLAIFNDEAKDRTLVFPSPRKALEELGKMGMMHVLCEGGLGLAKSLADEGLVDEWITVLAPIAIGNGKLANAMRFETKGVAGIDGDVMATHLRLH